MKKLVIHFIAVISILLGGGCCKRIEKTEAEKIAKKKLIEYCERKSLPLAKFSGPQFQEEKGNSWMVSYEMNAQSLHTVIVLVDCKGNSEVSFSEG